MLNPPHNSGMIAVCVYSWVSSSVLVGMFVKNRQKVWPSELEKSWKTCKKNIYLNNTGVKKARLTLFGYFHLSRTVNYLFVFTTIKLQTFIKSDIFVNVSIAKNTKKARLFVTFCPCSKK